jgi:hypothetical protein
MVVELAQARYLEQLQISESHLESCWSMRGAAYDDDFETILDDSSLHGWKMCGPGMFVLEHRMIISKGGMGLLWYTKKKFRDFILRVDWKTSRREDNSGVFVRFAHPDDSHI